MDALVEYPFQAVSSIRTASTVPLSLPKPASNIRPVPSTRLNIDQIKRSKHRYGPNLSSSLPKGLDSGMEVLPDGIGTGIPKAYPFG